jgi:hypothetical protein
MIINDAGDLLEAVALEIEQRGWTQRQSEDPLTGKVCIGGALQKAATSTTPGEVFQQAFRQLEYNCKISGGYTSEVFNSITMWNDNICTSQEQAVEMVRQAAKQAHKAETTS